MVLTEYSYYNGIKRRCLIMAYTPGKKGVNPFAKGTKKKDEDMKGKKKTVKKK